jgi:hypothetical protein
MSIMNTGGEFYNDLHRKIFSWHYAAMLREEIPQITFIVSQGEKSFISRRFFLAEGDKTLCCGKIVKI